MAALATVIALSLASSTRVSAFVGAAPSATAEARVRLQNEAPLVAVQEPCHCTGSPCNCFGAMQTNQELLWNEWNSDLKANVATAAKQAALGSLEQTQDELAGATRDMIRAEGKLEGVSDVLQTVSNAAPAWLKQMDGMRQDATATATATAVTAAKADATAADAKKAVSDATNVAVGIASGAEKAASDVAKVAVATASDVKEDMSEIREEITTVSADLESHIAEPTQIIAVTAAVDGEGEQASKQAAKRASKQANAQAGTIVVPVSSAGASLTLPDVQTIVPVDTTSSGYVNIVPSAVAPAQPAQSVQVVQPMQDVQPQPAMTVVQPMQGVQPMIVAGSGQSVGTAVPLVSGGITAR